MLGVTKLLGLGIVWIAGFTISGVVLTIDWGSEGGPKLSIKSHNPLVFDGMVGVDILEEMVGTCAT